MERGLEALRGLRLEELNKKDRRKGAVIRVCNAGINGIGDGALTGDVIVVIGSQHGLEEGTLGIRSGWWVQSPLSGSLTIRAEARPIPSRKGKGSGQWLGNGAHRHILGVEGRVRRRGPPERRRMGRLLAPPL